MPKQQCKTDKQCSGKKSQSHNGAVMNESADLCDVRLQVVTTRAADKQCLPGEGNTRYPVGEAPIDDVTGDTPGSVEQLEENPVQSANCECSAAELASLQASDSDIAPIRAVSYTHLTLPTKRIV